MKTLDRFMLKMVLYLYISIGAFILGYVLGRIESLHERFRRLEHQGPLHDLNTPKKWFTQDGSVPASTPRARAPISIDDSKFVTEVSTAGLEKPQDLALGEKKTVQDDIQAAASRLAQLKRS